MNDHRFEYIRNQIISELIDNEINALKTTMKNNPKRATGRTLGLALQCIGKAVENPGKEVEFIDHHPLNRAQLQSCKQQIELLAKTLNLDVTVVLMSNKLDDRVKPEPFSLYVKSNWVSPYSQRTPVEEAFKDNYGVYPNELKSVEASHK
jgi:hypothetical protein